MDVQAANSLHPAPRTGMKARIAKLLWNVAVVGVCLYLTWEPVRLMRSHTFGALAAMRPGDRLIDALGADIDGSLGVLSMWSTVAAVLSPFWGSCSRRWRIVFILLGLPLLPFQFGFAADAIRGADIFSAPGVEFIWCYWFVTWPVVVLGRGYPSLVGAGVRYLWNTPLRMIVRNRRLMAGVAVAVLFVLVVLGINFLPGPTEGFYGNGPDDVAVWYYGDGKVYLCDGFRNTAKLWGTYSMENGELIERPFRLRLKPGLLSLTKEGPGGRRTDKRLWNPNCLSTEW